MILGLISIRLPHRPSSDIPQVVAIVTAKGYRWAYAPTVT